MEGASFFIINLSKKYGSIDMLEHGNEMDKLFFLNHFYTNKEDR